MKEEKTVCWYVASEKKGKGRGKGRGRKYKNEIEE